MSKTIIAPLEIKKCQFCNSVNFKKFGIRRNKCGDIQRYFCRDCRRTFSINVGFEKMKNSPKAITLAMQMYFSGESLRSVARTLKLVGYDVSHQTVYKWIKKYTLLMEKYVEKLIPKVSDTWRADELYFKVKGNYQFLYSLMDNKSRFWIAKQVSNKKFTEDVRPILQRGKELTQKRPLKFITDGARNFQTAYKKEFRTLKGPRTEHIRHIHLKNDNNNNRMERLNGEIRDREKVMRGLQKTDTPILDGMKLYHNFIRPHEGLKGKTPADVCGIEIMGNNKWLTLIQNAKLS